MLLIKKIPFSSPTAGGLSTLSLKRTVLSGGFQVHSEDKVDVENH